MGEAENWKTKLAARRAKSETLSMPLGSRRRRGIPSGIGKALRCGVGRMRADSSDSRNVARAIRAGTAETSAGKTVPRRKSMLVRNKFQTRPAGVRSFRLPSDIAAEIRFKDGLRAGRIRTRDTATCRPILADYAPDLHVVHIREPWQPPDSERNRYARFTRLGCDPL